MDLICDGCNAHLGKVEATARLILTVHCAFCGKDFGVAVEPPVPVEGAPATPPNDVPPAA